MKSTYVATSTVYVTDKNGNVKVLKPGTALSPKDWNKISSDTARAKFNFVVKSPAARRERFTGAHQEWTPDQLRLMIDLYLHNVDPVNQEDNRETISDLFLVQFPERNPSGVKMLIMQIKAHDSLYDADGLQSSKLLREMLVEKDPARFS